MIDYYLRDKANLLTGLTRYTQYAELTPQALTDGDWTTVYSSVESEEHKVYAAYQVSITGDPVTAPLLRILAVPTGGVLDASAKVWPFGDAMEIISGISSPGFNIPLQVPVQYDFSVQVKVTGTGALATLDFISVIEVPVLNHA